MTKATETAADKAVAHILWRIQRDPRLAYFFGLTESLSLLTKAYAEANGLDLETYRIEFNQGLRFEAPIREEVVNALGGLIAVFDDHPHLPCEDGELPALDRARAAYVNR